MDPSHKETVSYKTYSLKLLPKKKEYKVTWDKLNKKIYKLRAEELKYVNKIKKN